MAVQPVVLIGNELLRKQSVPVDFGSEDISSLITDLKDTLHQLQREKQTGRALAAPQIGCLQQVIYMDAYGREIVMVNPEVTEMSIETWEVWDSCFSAEAAFFGKTVRSCSMNVAYLDEAGEKKEEIFKGDLSELFQHEIDHLNGVLFIERIIDNQIMMRQEWEKMAGE